MIVHIKEPPSPFLEAPAVLDLNLNYRAGKSWRRDGMKSSINC